MILYGNYNHGIDFKRFQKASLFLDDKKYKMSSNRFVVYNQITSSWGLLTVQIDFGIIPDQEVYLRNYSGNKWDN